MVKAFMVQEKVLILVLLKCGFKMWKSFGKFQLILIFCDDFDTFWCRVEAEAGFCDGNGTFWCRNGTMANGSEGTGITGSCRGGGAGTLPNCREN